MYTEFCLNYLFYIETNSFHKIDVNNLNVSLGFILDSEVQLGGKDDLTGVAGIMRCLSWADFGGSNSFKMRRVDGRVTIASETDQFQIWRGVQTTKYHPAYVV